MKKRIFSAALAGCMMLTMVPVTAFAAEEGATEVAIEQYAALADPRIERVDLDNKQFDLTGMSKELGDFINKSDQLLAVTDFDAFYDKDPAKPTTKASRNGYYLPAMIHVPGATSAATIKIVRGQSANLEDPDDRTDKEETIAFDNSGSLVADKEGRLSMLIQVARLDGDIFDWGFEAVVDPDGPDGAIEPTTIKLDYSDVQLVASKYMNATELKISTENSLQWYDTTGSLVTVKVSDLYDASTNTVKNISWPTFSNVVAEQSGYYLPLSLEVDDSENFVAEIPDGKYDNGVDRPLKTVTSASLDGTAGKKVLNIFVRIADAEGKLIRDSYDVIIYPQGKGQGLPSKTVSFDYSKVNLQQDEVVVKAKLPTQVASNVAQYLAYRNNLEQIESVELKDGVLTVTADLASLAITAGTGNSARYEIPVLFTMTKDGKSIVKAQDGVASYGGTSKTDWMELVNLRPTVSEPAVTVEGTNGVSRTVKYKVVDASKVPVLSDSTVTVEDGEMTGLTAQQGAKTVADIKAMYTANGGSVVIKNAAGTRTLTDTDRIGTGCTIVLNDRNGDPVGDPVVVVVKGDVTGEGYAHLGQVVAAGRALVGKDTLEGAFLTAGDINGNGQIDLGDIVGIGQIVVAAR